MILIKQNSGMCGKVFILVFNVFLLLIFCQCSNNNSTEKSSKSRKDDYNIEIIDSEFVRIIEHFDSTASNYVPSGVYTISISIKIENSDTIVLLYSNNPLKNTNYIGKTKVNGKDVLFYSKNNLLEKKLYNIIFTSSASDRKVIANDPPFMDGYIYSDGEKLKRYYPIM